MPQIPYRPEAQKKRYDNSEQALKEAGGKRLNVRLQPKANKVLQRLVKRWKLSQSDVVNKILEDAA